MGLSYSFQFVARRPSVDAVLARLAELLGDRSRSSLEQALPWHPAAELSLRAADGEPRVIALGIRDNPPTGGPWSEGVIWLRFPATPELLAFHERPPGPNFSEAEPYVRPSEVEVQAALSISAGAELAVVAVDARFSSVSRLFQDSNTIRAALTSVATDAGCEALVFDDETGTVEVLHPSAARGRRVQLPDDDSLYLDDELHTDVDRVYASLCSSVLLRA